MKLFAQDLMDDDILIALFASGSKHFTWALQVFKAIDRNNLEGDVTKLISMHEDLEKAANWFKELWNNVIKEQMAHDTQILERTNNKKVRAQEIIDPEQEQIDKRNIWFNDSVKHLKWAVEIFNKIDYTNLLNYETNILILYENLEHAAAYLKDLFTDISAEQEQYAPTEGEEIH